MLGRLFITALPLAVLAQPKPQNPPQLHPRHGSHEEITAVTLIEYTYDTRLVASVVSANPSATTYSLGCPPNEGTTCFGYGSGIPAITLVGGPSTAAETLIAEEGGATIKVSCRLTATSPSYGGPCVHEEHSGALGYTTSFDAGGLIWATFVGITVTGGLEKLESGNGGGGSGTSTRGGPTVTTSSTRGGETSTGVKGGGSSSSGQGGDGVLTTATGSGTGSATPKTTGSNGAETFGSGCMHVSAFVFTVMLVLAY